jgi:hypothetical protein
MSQGVSGTYLHIVSRFSLGSETGSPPRAIAICRSQSPSDWPMPTTPHATSASQAGLGFTLRMAAHRRGAKWHRLAPGFFTATILETPQRRSSLARDRRCRLIGQQRNAVLLCLCPFSIDSTPEYACSPGDIHMNLTGVTRVVTVTAQILGFPSPWSTSHSNNSMLIMGISTA